MNPDNRYVNYETRKVYMYIPVEFCVVQSSQISIHIINSSKFLL